MPWTIDNKYYTANISFEPRPTSLAVAGDYPVLLYLFSGQVRPSSFPHPLYPHQPSSLRLLAVTLSVLKLTTGAEPPPC